jgi:hypothetical protein
MADDITDDELDGLSAMHFTPTTRLKVNLKKAREMVKQDYSRFKVNEAYRLKHDAVTILLINEIGPDPVSRLMTGYGLLITVDDIKPGYLPLSELSDSVFR